jgi:hypothetical protein
MPVMLHMGVAHGPRDRLGPFVVADLVKAWAEEPDRTDEDKALAGRFLRQWPNGPQLARVPGVMGRPQKFAKTDMLGFRIETADLERVPRNAKGNPDQDWLREAVREKLGREGL